MGTPKSIEFIDKVKFLFEPHMSKVLYGGRDSCKSWSMARALLIHGTMRPERILCARETMNSMADSVHKLLSDQIEAMGLSSYYEVLKSTIKSRPGAPFQTEFIFKGLQDVSAIKSTERITKLWVEEAEAVSKHSWETVLPTIRAEGSEVWVSFNPKLATDDTYKRWVLNPPPGCVSVKLLYTDNPWLSRVSVARIEHLRVSDPKTFEHVYGGEPVSSLEGAIFADEVKAAHEEGRFGLYPYDKTKPVDVVYDLGFGDPTVQWYVQAIDGWLHFIDYYIANQQDISHFVLVAQQKPYVIGTHYLPHDGTNNLTHRKLLGVNDKTMSLQSLMEGMGCRVAYVPALGKHEVINAARAKWPKCRFDIEKCADGVQALRHYSWDRAMDEAGKRKPLHDWASHPADAFIGACLCAKESRRRELPRVDPAFIPSGAWA